MRALHRNPTGPDGVVLGGAGCGLLDIRQSGRLGRYGTAGTRVANAIGKFPGSGDGLLR